MSEWLTVSLNEIAFINPTEKLAKGTVATKIGMDNLQPFSKKVSAQIQEPYNGGMKFRNGDTIVARITPCLENGKTAYIDTLDDGAVGYGSTEYIVLRAKEDSSDSHFLYYFARSDTFRDVAIASMTGSSGRQRVQTDVVVNHTFELPSLPEQKAIASVLSSLDNKIDLLHRQNKTLEAMAETLFRQWFIEEAKEDWEEASLGSLFTISSGKGLKREQFRDHGLIPVLGANGEIGRTDQVMFEEFLIYTGRVGTLGKVSIIEGQPVWLSDNTLVFRDIEYFYFTYFQLKAVNYQEYNVGSTQPLIRQSDIKEIAVLLPSDLDMIKRFELQAKDIFGKIQTNTKQIQTLENLRDTLLPKLMSGEVRVQYQTEEIA